MLQFQHFILGRFRDLVEQADHRHTQPLRGTNKHWPGMEIAQSLQSAFIDPPWQTRLAPL
ncbi:predicted protein [Plenodomus lingam JN3]|uniref:Predicted protein n=1 Tax=Leptosphaeria maculans (strain JN3 / isolate v23.1.3 / race Av1-4-5-6-7-8) TaxID=985895 RepID=E4ZZK3_LEPMJ|nr:predicted protein [Plenodomus lingam JN3]CBX97119.1 predicted protein [Plenodomus lingam JN3]